MKDDALKVLEKTRLVTLATLNEDGSPRATPVLADYRDGRINWRSSEDAIHSQNIARDPRVYLSSWYEDSDSNEFEAIYIPGYALKSEDDIAYSENLKADTFEYYVVVGELDETKSSPHRYYFRPQEQPNEV